MGPVYPAAHVHFAFIEGHQVRPPVLYLGQREMRVVLRIGNGGRRGIGQLQEALGRNRCFGMAVKRDIQPLSVLLILHLAGDGVLLGIEAGKAAKVYEEDVARAGIGQAITIHTRRRHRDVPGFGVVQDGDVLHHPLTDLFGRLIGLEILEVLPEEMVVGA